MIKDHVAILITTCYLILRRSIQIYKHFSKDEEISLANVTSKYCNTNYVWLAITDHQQEDNFLDISKFSSEAIFTQESIVGEPLKVKHWKENQPNGGTIENCVAKGVERENHDKSWSNVFCDGKLCVTCSMGANKLFQLRGLCPKTL